MITIKVKPITFDNDVRTDTYEIQGDSNELYDFRRCKYPRDKYGMPQLCLVELTVAELKSMTFITTGDYLGKNVVRNVERIVAQRYMHCVTR